MVEHLDHLLAGDHLLHIAVPDRQSLLLAWKRLRLVLNRMYQNMTA